MMGLSLITAHGYDFSRPLRGTQWAMRSLTSTAKGRFTNSNVFEQKVNLFGINCVVHQKVLTQVS